MRILTRHIDLLAAHETAALATVLDADVSEVHAAVALHPTRVVPGEWGTHVVGGPTVESTSGAALCDKALRHVAALDSPIEHVLQTALQSDPSQRYSSAAALASVVDGLVAANDDTVLLRTRTYQPRTEQLCVSN